MPRADDDIRLAVMSDIHGNLAALEAVLDDVRQHHVAGIVVAGDLVGGPQPLETIRLLRSFRCWTVCGNVDRNVVRYGKGNVPESWRTSRQWALKRWTYGHLDRDAFEFLKSLPEERVVEITDADPIRVVHKPPQAHAEPASANREPMLVCGHTHCQCTQEQNGRMMLNPGAVSGPLDGYLGAQYALLSWREGRWRAEHRRVPYDLVKVREAFRETGLLTEGGAMAQALLRSIETGRNCVDELLAHAYRSAEEAGIEDCKIVPDSIWDRAVATFRW